MAKKKKTSALDKWLAGDVTYQQQLADFNRALAEYNATYDRQRSMTNRDYGESQRALNLQGTQDRADQQNDFAGRGILHSGVYAKALGDYNTQFQLRKKALTTGMNDKLGDLAMQKKNFTTQTSLEKNNAKQDAIRRRAQQLGI